MHSANFAGPPSFSQATLTAFMVAKRKALLNYCQALLRGIPVCQYQAMLTATDRVRACFAEAFPKGGKHTPSAIAKYCGVSKQAVTAWRKTGRISKVHLLKLAELSGRPVQWWIGSASASDFDELLALWPDLIPGQRQEFLRDVRVQAQKNREIKQHMENRSIGGFIQDEGTPDPVRLTPAPAKGGPQRARKRLR
jgi:hypothetical protein